MFYTVYKITNLVNGKIYIGVHKTSNLDDGYMGSGTILSKAKEKYGIENFKKEIIKIFDNPEEMFNMESKLVNEEFVGREDTYNLNKGGFGGFEYINSNKLNNSTNNQTKAKNAMVLSREETPENWETSNLKAGERLKKLHQEGKIKYDNFSGMSHSEETNEKLRGHKRQSGSNNSQFGTMWIHSLTEKVSKKIKKDEFPGYETQGWLKGRKMKFI